MEETIKEIEQYLKVTYPDDWFLLKKIEILKVDVDIKVKKSQIEFYNKFIKK
tara:strand:- start:567 stop:722 length:156 start_codon:yes stop_codon:yes gene_type:complete